jgi:hypothetical protein
VATDKNFEPEDTTQLKLDEGARNVKLVASARSWKHLGHGLSGMERMGKLKVVGLVHGSGPAGA